MDGRKSPRLDGLEGSEQVVRRLPVLVELGLDLRQGRRRAAENAHRHAAHELTADEAERNRRTLDGQEDGCVFDGGPGVDLSVEREEVDLVGVEGPPVLRRAHDGSVQEDAAVGGVYALHVAVQIVLERGKKYVEKSSLKGSKRQFDGWAKIDASRWPRCRKVTRVVLKK